MTPTPDRQQVMLLTKDGFRYTLDAMTREGFDSAALEAGDSGMAIFTLEEPQIDTIGRPVTGDDGSPIMRSSRYAIPVENLSALYITDPPEPLDPEDQKLWDQLSELQRSRSNPSKQHKLIDRLGITGQLKVAE